jgi:hypothetical protein
MVVGALRIISMSERSATQSPQPRPEDRAVTLFAEMDVAQARGEYSRAAEAQRQLERLGWVITRKRPSLKAMSRAVQA